MSESDTNNNIVRYEFDPTNPPPLTDQQREELRRLDDLKDEDIDFSDIPPLTEKFWANGVRGKFYRPVKEQLTLRLDADIIHWFKSRAKDGKGYQTAINAALRKVVEGEMGK
jgi:uncharacterized protein (DUF4415 family)